VNAVNQFLKEFEESIATGNFRKLTLGKLRDELSGAEHVYVRLVQLNDGQRLSLVHRYPTNDVTKNYPVADALKLIRSWLGEACLAASLFTSSNVLNCSSIAAENLDCIAQPRVLRIPRNPSNRLITIGQRNDCYRTRVSWNASASSMPKANLAPTRETNIGRCISSWKMWRHCSSRCALATEFESWTWDAAKDI